MKTGLNIGIKQTQKLVMTPALRQSIEILQMSTIELSEMISQEFLENPMLEEITSSQDENVIEERLNRNLSGDDSVEIRKSSENEIYENSSDSGIIGSSDDEDRNRLYIENAVTVKESLKEHLLWQAKMTVMDEDELVLYEEVITFLNDDGFLEKEQKTRLEADSSQIEEVISRISQFDPVGCGMEDLRQSLSVQARFFYPEDEILHKLIDEFFSELEKLDYNLISREMCIPVADVIEKSKILHNLNPFPGRLFSTRGVRFIVPDIEVRLVDGEIIVSLNDDWIPGIKLSSYYMNLLRKKKMNKEQHEYMTGKLHSARALVKNISSRRETISKVVHSIMDHQKEFLVKGPGHLRYLTHHDIAEEVGVHESTVSRVASNKFVQTSWGAFELKYFFVSRLKTPSADENDDQSSDRVKGMIQQIISNENPEKPCSDEEIVGLLKNNGITAARRTVAKYRESLSIPSSSKRKRINMIKS